MQHFLIHLKTYSCMFWGGVTTENTNGPIPGETLTILGSCSLPASTTTVYTGSFAPSSVVGAGLV